MEVKAHQSTQKNSLRTLRSQTTIKKLFVDKQHTHVHSTSLPPQMAPASCSVGHPRAPGDTEEGRQSMSASSVPLQLTPSRKTGTLLVPSLGMLVPLAPEGRVPAEQWNMHPPPTYWSLSNYMHNVILMMEDCD